ncbi:MAG: hypothetical protein HOV81_33490 [Kofleriaceae bacterium]|nr:hypothetical protein [Kofleriaceae bacterium]
MRARAFALLGAGGAGLLAFGVWLGAQRPSADAPAATPAASAPVAARTQAPTRPMLATRKPTPGLAADLRDPDPRVRRNAIAELAASDAADPDTLLAASRDANLDVALAATEGLGALYRSGRIDAKVLADRASDPSANVKIRVAAVNGLGLAASDDAGRLLADLVAHGDDYARRTAAISLVHQDPQIAVPALISALRDADQNVRENAHESLRALARGRDLGEDPTAWQRWWQSRAT